MTNLLTTGHKEALTWLYDGQSLSGRTGSYVSLYLPPGWERITPGSVTKVTEKIRIAAGEKDYCQMAVDGSLTSRPLNVLVFVNGRCITSASSTTLASRRYRLSLR